MEQFILFIQRYLPHILVFSLSIIELLLLIFQKKVKIDSIKEKILEALPFCISIVEKLGIKGSEQKKLACVEFLKDFVKFDSSYDEFISESIERILSTPEKKGF